MKPLSHFSKVLSFDIMILIDLRVGYKCIEGIVNIICVLPLFLALYLLKKTTCKMQNVSIVMKYYELGLYKRWFDAWYIVFDIRKCNWNNFHLLSGSPLLLLLSTCIRLVEMRHGDKLLRTNRNSCHSSF